MKPRFSSLKEFIHCRRKFHEFWNFPPVHGFYGPEKDDTSWRLWNHLTRNYEVAESFGYPPRCMWGKVPPTTSARL